MFTSFVDAKILSKHKHKPLSEEFDYILYFDQKIQFLLSLVANNFNLSNNSFIFTDNQLHVTERPLDFLFSSTNFLQYQNNCIKMNIIISADYEVASPHLLLSTQNKLLNNKNETSLQTYSNEGIFPDLCPNDFEIKLSNDINDKNKVIASPWKQQNKKQNVLNVLDVKNIF